MSEPNVNVTRLKPDTQHPLSELNTLVRVPGNPSAIKAFTDSEVAAGKATAYAAVHAGHIQPLPLALPAGAASPARVVNEPGQGSAGLDGEGHCASVVFGPGPCRIPSG